MLLDLISEYDSEKKKFLSDLRKQIVLQLSKNSDPKKIVTFLGKCGVVSIDDKELVVYIAAPNEFVLSQVRKYFVKPMSEAIQTVFNPTFKPKFIIYPPFQGVNHDLLVNLTQLLGIKQSDIAMDSKTHDHIKQMFGILFEKKFSFESFVVGAANNFAFSAAKAVAENPGKVYNPLFIYGSVGLGKTHLMQSIGNYVMENFPKKVVVYLPCTKLIDEIIDAIKTNKMSQLNRKLDEVDVLIIDDIQFLADKERTQEVFHTIFNDFVSKDKQIVISSDRPPKDLRDIEDRLKSRFSHGLVGDIKTPDFETRLAILKQKLMTVDNVIAQELLEIVAKYVKENVRELEGALNLFLTKRKFSGRELEQKDIYEGLGTLGYKFSNELQKTIETPMVNQKGIQGFTDILNYVATYYDIPASEIIGESRKKEVSQTRQLMMYIAKKHFHRTLEKIGEYFGGKNHATVIYAVNNFQKILKADPQVASEYTQFVDKIGN